MTFDYSAQQQAITRVLAKDLFFIAGSVKSGTTWLQLILDGHPQVACRGEGHFTQHLAPNLEKALNGYNRLIAEKNKTIFSEIEGFPRLKREHLLHLLTSAIGLQLAQYGGGTDIIVVGEKTPDNIRALPLLNELFPRAKFLHIIRDGRDIAVSGWFHNLRVSPDWAQEKFGSLSAYAAHFAPNWVGQVQMGRQFGAQLPDRYFELRYEDLHQDTPLWVKRALDFLGVEASEDAITKCCEAGDFERLTGGRAAGEEDKTSHFRKGTTGDWRNHFDDEAAKAFAEKAGGLMADLGYE